MSNIIPESEIKSQSVNCYNQWKEQWRKQAKYHGMRFEMKDMERYRNSGIGKAMLCIANGYSFEENIDIIKENQKNVDILACDKTLMHCIENGIKVDFCVVCDANVSYETYLEPIKDKLQDTVLLINVCAATKWAAMGNWKEVICFTNKDILGSEKEFASLSGSKVEFAAGTNVSNQMIIAMTQSINNQPQNFFGYDKYLLIGFDYCWQDNYYAFDHDGGGKINYMKNMYLTNLGGELCFTSTNLMFSARWFNDYLKIFKLPVFQCSKKSIVRGPNELCDLAESMRYSYAPEDATLVQRLVTMKAEIIGKLVSLDKRLSSISFDHKIKALYGG